MKSVLSLIIIFLFSIVYAAEEPFLLVLKKGAPIKEAIIEELSKKDIESASFSAIGAIENPEIAYYNLETKKFESTTYLGIYEVASLDGNLVEQDGKPFIHAHIVIGDRIHGARAGHLMGGSVGVTLEALVTPLEQKWERVKDSTTGLGLLQESD